MLVEVNFHWKRHRAAGVGFVAAAHKDRMLLHLPSACPAEGIPFVAG
jgi:hypothetical protein